MALLTLAKNIKLADAEKMVAKIKREERKLKSLGSNGNYKKVEFYSTGSEVITWTLPWREIALYSVFVETID